MKATVESSVQREATLLARMEILEGQVLPLSENINRSPSTNQGIAWGLTAPPELPPRFITAAVYKTCTKPLRDNPGRQLLPSLLGESSLLQCAKRSAALSRDTWRRPSDTRRESQHGAQLGSVPVAARKQDSTTLTCPHKQATLAKGAGRSSSGPLIGSPPEASSPAQLLVRLRAFLQTRRRLPLRRLSLLAPLGSRARLAAALAMCPAHARTAMCGRCAACHRGCLRQPTPGCMCRCSRQPPDSCKGQRFNSGVRTHIPCRGGNTRTQR